MADLVFDSQVKQRVTMNKSMKGLLVAIIIFNSSFSMGDMASTKEKVLVEHIFPYQPRDVWAAIGQFCSIKKWQSFVEDCFIEQRFDGIYRVVIMKDSDAFIERLEEYSEENMSLTYSILKGPLEVKGYRSELKVKGEGAEKTKLEWRAWYEDEGVGIKKIETSSLLEGLFKNGITGMHSIIEN